MRSSSRRPVVAHVTRYVADYRAPYFACLRTKLEQRDVDFRLIHGQPGPVDRPRRDEVTLPLAEHVRNRYLLVRGREICWQPYLHLLDGVDLAIVDQGARLLATYALLARRRLGGPAVALWGHGLHFDEERALGASEALKGFVAREADWWFPYTMKSVAVVRSLGVPPERMTLIENAIDTRNLVAWRRELQASDLDAQRKALGVTSTHVGVYTGAIYAKKRPGFLVAAADAIRARVADFELVVVGDGPSAGIIREAARSRPWLHAVGARYGQDKVRQLALGKVMLLPGLVGLNLLDGFALGLPPITTAIDYHSHEIVYLQNGVNGLIVDQPEDVPAYARAVVRVLTNEALHARLVAGCKAAVEHYTIENMAENVADGCLNALSSLGRMRTSTSPS